MVERNAGATEQVWFRSTSGEAGLTHSNCKGGEEGRGEAGALTFDGGGVPMRTMGAILRQRLLRSREELPTQTWMKIQTTLAA